MNETSFKYIEHEVNPIANMLIAIINGSGKYPPFNKNIRIINKRTNEVIEPVIRVITQGYEGYNIDDVLHFTSNGAHRMDALTYPSEDWTWELINK